tara:strand:- start:219 stop:431 length:213 start_codon:yes stop_codon:yes gene_type:complete
MRHAYDYDAQVWVEGRAASKLALAQAREELAVMNGERGAAYLAFVNSPHSPDEFVAILESAIATFEAELA